MEEEEEEDYDNYEEEDEEIKEEMDEDQKLGEFKPGHQERQGTISEEITDKKNVT